MIAPYLPSILVPLVGILFPGLSMALLFIYIEQETIS
uniref:Photosystem I reaction center subunit VIII n=1 Tax=Rhodogorgon sp. TaxID=2485824 RepID=A0A3G3MI76_9FLOR|nr:photosystem I subunit VIII [Rhodogorgon sp.]